MNELNDKELLEQLNMLKQDAENIDIPESLEPENMMKRIEQMEKIKQERDGCFEEQINNSKGSFWGKMGKALKKNRFLQSGIAAAVVVGVLTTAFVMTIDKKSNQATSEYYDMIKVTEDNEVSVLSGYSALHNYLVVEKTMEKKHSFMEKIEDIFGVFDDLNFGASDDAASENSGTSNSPTSDREYSDTNTRTENVHEADVVKTDGEYIYYIEKSSGKGAAGVYLAIYNAEGKNTEAVCKVSLDEHILKAVEREEDIYADDNDDNMYELILYKNKLVVITDYQYQTVAIFYDIADRTKPTHINTMTIDGYYDSCKMVDDYLYIFSKKEIRIDIKNDKNRLEEKEARELLGVRTNEGIIDSRDVYVSACDDYDIYVVMGTVDMNDLDNFKQVKAILGSDRDGVLYMSNENIYYISSKAPVDKSELEAFDKNIVTHDVDATNESEIISLSYKEGIIEPKYKTCIEGWIEDEFDVDEYNGYLRLALSVTKTNYTFNKCDVRYFNGVDWVIDDSWEVDDIYREERYSSLVVLDSQLKKAGAIEKLKKEEEVYGVRFDGDIGYVVTYRQMDPLFTIDLSDPTNPKVIGELKIPGFSEYLHKWDDNTLIGIGRDDGWNIKISTFDITDKANVYERDICVLKEVYYTDALYNHRAVLIAPEKNLIGFSCNDGEFYNVYAYIDGRLTQVISQEIRFSDANGYGNINTRGLYIGEYIYIVNEKEGIYVYDMNSFERVK